MSQELYYTAPSDDIFEELKEVVIALWKTYDDTHGYATEKVDSIKDIKNISDNFMYILAMFDSHNIEKIKMAISKECLEEIDQRMN